MSKHKLSLLAAIVININIMLGSGIFINTVLLSKNAGLLGAAVYPIVGLLIFPLIYSISNLLKFQLGGTFYHFGATISPYIGFLSSWAYFTAKMASCGLSIHVCLSLLQKVFSGISQINTLYLDLLVIFLFVLLNRFNLKIGKSIQISFIALKLIPILFVILSSIFLFSGTNFDSSALVWTGIPASIPFVLFAFSGFEASCSLSNSIEDSEKNAPKAILISFFTVVTVVTLFQFLFYANLGPELSGLSSYLEAFPALVGKLFGSGHNLKNTIIGILHIGIASSALGAAYGIMYSNTWNLYALAEHKHIFGHNILTKLNKHNIPFYCTVIEGLIAASYLLFTKGNQVPLQQISAFGGAIAYTISVIAYTVLDYRQNNRLSFLPVASLLSCAILIAACIRSFLLTGFAALIGLLLIIAFGSFMFFNLKNKNK
jgi:amino acid transporter